MDKQSADIKTQKIELKEIEPLIPQLRELKNAGVDFTLLTQIVATLNEAAIFQNVNLNVAAANVAQEIRLCREYGGVKQAIERAQQQLSTIESLSVGANTTGHTYTAGATAMNYQTVTGSTGTSISISFIEVYGNATPAAAATGPNYQHFENTPRRILGRQNYNPFGGGQMVIFG